MQLRQMSAPRGRKVSVPEIQPMSTVEESPADSPTVPAKYTSPPFISEDATHSRSSSAPGEHRLRVGTHARGPSGSKLRSAWTNRQADQPPQPVMGLGLTLPTQQFAPRQPRRTGPGRPKPNLRINVDHEDRPPPPPPKSPRHSRAPSAASVQSGVSSMHGESPDSATVVTPTSIQAPLRDTRSDAMPTPKPLKAEQASYYQSNGPLRVREVAIPRDRNKQVEPAALQRIEQNNDRSVLSKAPELNVDKPMPNLPTPSKRFSAHVREIQEAEKSRIDASEDTAPPAKAQSSAPIDTSPPKKPSMVASDRKTTDVDIQHFPQPLKFHHKAPSRDIRSPTPDLASRPESPANLLQTVSTSTKVLPILPNEAPPPTRSATPDTVATLLKPLEPKTIRLGPLQELQDLNRQSEALHERYASLRADRVKISTGISASLRDEKPGSEYANNLLDQHLALNAINSSMDICFAKLKSLDCRKEEAMQAVLRQEKTKITMEEVRKSPSMKSLLAPPLTTSSGRSTPETGPEPKTLTPELIPTSKFASIKPNPEPTSDENKTLRTEGDEKKEVPQQQKRITIIRASMESGETTPSSDSMPISPITSIHDLYSTRRIRIKGAKAAKILGLVAQSASGTETSKCITLPDNSPGMPGSFKKPIAVEVEIQQRPIEKKNRTTSPSTSEAAPKMPKRKPPPTPMSKHDASDSVSSSVASSQAESSPEESEIKTPTGSDEMPFGLKSAKRGMLQTIQVFVDDDILDYYNGSLH